MIDNTNAERQRRYIARLKQAAKAGVTNAPAPDALVQELARAKARIAELEKEIEGLRLHIRFGPKRRPAEPKPKVEKPPLPPDEERDRIIKGLKTANRNLRIKLHVMEQHAEDVQGKSGNMSFRTTSAIMKGLHPEQRKHLTRAELDAVLDDGCKAFTAWKGDRDTAQRKAR